MAWTKEKQKAYNKAYYAANRERLLEQKRVYQRAYSEANKEKVAAQHKSWYEANREQINAQHKAYYEANREEINAKRKAYREANREKACVNSARRRALKRKQIPVHLRDCPKEKERLVQIYTLRNILSQATGVEHHVDHMWPLADGGPHWSGNLQVIPAEENLRKNASVCEDTKGIIFKSLYTFESERPI